MLRTLLAITLSVAAVSIPASAIGSSKAIVLTGVVGPASDISLKNADGTNVTHLDPGTYDVSVTDNSAAHNFHLSGPGVDMATDVEATGTVTWTITVVDGKYTFVCDAHPTFMKGSFTVGAFQEPPPPPTPGKLSGKVTTSRIFLHTSNGAKATTIVSKQYKLTVSDTSNKQNFHLTGPGVNKKTGVAAKKKTTWTLLLRPGTYKFRSDKNRKLHGSFKVIALV